MSHILILDSGVGGLTVWHEIQKLLPKVSCDYVADNAFFPYGTKSDMELEQRLERLISYFVEKLKKNYQTEYSAIVIACNSASTVVLDHLRAQFQIPIVGVVPAIKPAAFKTQKKTIGLLATEGTINGRYTKKLITDYAADCEVIKVASQKLVSLAELKMQKKNVDDKELMEIVKPLIDANVDVVVLGCTHFPWFKENFENLCPTISWIDSGEAIAKRVKVILAGVIESNLTRKFYFTGNNYPDIILNGFDLEEHISETI